MRIVLAAAVAELASADLRPAAMGSSKRVWHAPWALENLAYSLSHEGPEPQAARWGGAGAVAAWDLRFLEAL